MLPVQTSAATCGACQGDNNGCCWCVLILHWFQLACLGVIIKPTQAAAAWSLCWTCLRRRPFSYFRVCRRWRERRSAHAPQLHLSGYRTHSPVRLRLVSIDCVARRWLGAQVGQGSASFLVSPSAWPHRSRQSKMRRTWRAGSASALWCHPGTLGKSWQSAIDGKYLPMH